MKNYPPSRVSPGLEAFFIDVVYRVPGWMLGGEIAEMDEESRLWGGHSYVYWLNTDDQTHKKVQYATIAGNYSPFGFHSDGAVDTGNVYLPFAKFNPVIYAAHNDDLGGHIDDLSLTSCTYSAEFIRRWMFQDRIEKNSSLVPQPGYASPIIAGTPFNIRQGLFFELANGSAISLQVTMFNISNERIGVYGFPVYSGYNDLVIDFTGRELATAAYFDCFRVYDITGIIFGPQTIKTACIRGWVDHPLLPDTTITNAEILQNAANFNFTSDTGTEFSYKFDSQDWSPWGTQRAVNANFLSPGSHIFWVRSRIANTAYPKYYPKYYIDSTPASHAFIIRGPLDISTLGEGTHYSGFQNRSNLVIVNNMQWQEVWAELTRDFSPALSLPVVDFSREIVIAVFMGECRTSGYSTHITRVEENPGYIKGLVSEERPSVGAITLQVLTYPYHIIKLRKTSEQVAFIYE